MTNYLHRATRTCPQTLSSVIRIIQSCGFSIKDIMTQISSRPIYLNDPIVSAEVICKVMRRRSPSPPNHSDHIHTKPRDDQ